jgi:hypothetical protein
MLSEASYHNMTVGRIPSVEGGIQPTIVDAKGDLIVATGNDSPNRLAVGANNLVLTADSAQATGVKWADPLPSQSGQSGNYLTTNGTAASWGAISTGSITQIATGSFSSSTLTISSISSAYKNLWLVCKNQYNSADGQIRVRFNGDTGSNYSTSGAAAATSLLIIHSDTGTDGTTKSFSQHTIYDYASGTTPKFIFGSGYRQALVSATQYGAYNSLTAISSITLFLLSGTFSGGTYELYGVK